MNKAIALMIGPVVLFGCGTNDAATDTTTVDDSPTHATVDDRTVASTNSGAGDAASDRAAVGDGPWRAVVDDRRPGGPVDTGIRFATDTEMFDELWALLGRDREQPSIDFGEEVVVAFALSYPSGCEFPFLDLDIDESEAVITANYGGNEPAMCADDENQYLVVIVIDRDGLSHPRYEVVTSISGRTALLEP